MRQRISTFATLSGQMHGLLLRSDVKNVVSWVYPIEEIATRSGQVNGHLAGPLGDVNVLNIRSLVFRSGHVHKPSTGNRCCNLRSPYREPCNATRTDPWASLLAACRYPWRRPLGSPHRPAAPCSKTKQKRNIWGQVERTLMSMIRRSSNFFWQASLKQDLFQLWKQRKFQPPFQVELVVIAGGPPVKR